MGKEKMILGMLPVFALSMCSTFSTGNLCSVGAFVPDPGFEQRWTTGEKTQALVLNESGEKICGWSANS